MGALLRISCLMLKENSEPLPYSLCTSSFESIIASILFTMLIPRPVPSILRFLVSSTLSNGENSLSRSSGLMPIPVSFTETFR